MQEAVVKIAAKTPPYERLWSFLQSAIDLPSLTVEILAPTDYSVLIHFGDIYNKHTREPLKKQNQTKKYEHKFMPISWCVFREIL